MNGEHINDSTSSFAQHRSVGHIASILTYDSGQWSIAHASSAIDQAVVSAEARQELVNLPGDRSPLWSLGFAKLWKGGWARWGLTCQHLCWIYIDTYMYILYICR